MPKERLDHPQFHMKTINTFMIDVFILVYNSTCLERRNRDKYVKLSLALGVRPGYVVHSIRVKL